MNFRRIPLVILGACLVSTLSISVAKAAKKGKQAAKGKITKSASVSSTPRSKILAASRGVDRLIEAAYAKHKVKPNPISSDAVFVRRIYLDVIGRIPSYDEASTFLKSKDPQKRSKLIDKLLDSEGYVSHHFNYWADLLRIRSRMRYAPAQPYIDFVKQSLRDNKPYDRFVRELITAQGYTWDNGAAGYYLRDTGMPLDNMSNTAQVFLGTQLVCAQCHNHPFDTWTQKQYYQLAAFTYGIQTRDRRNGRFMELRGMYRKKDLDREVYRAATRILRPLAYKVNETNRKLRLPKDYQYTDAKPLATIEPKAIFGKDVVVKAGDSPRMVYARWMTSPRNPRFTKVIANRLWKRAMGLGLIEPVDDIKNNVKPSNPKLMKYLVAQVVGLNYDLKQYQRILFNTKTYQRKVTVSEIGDKPYYFPGPVLRRLSAEQLWDSLMVMTIPQVDQRKGITRPTGRYTDGEYLINKDMAEILVLAKDEAKRRRAQVKYYTKTRDLRKQMRVAARTNDRDKLKQLRDDMAKIRRQVYGAAGERRLQRAQNRSRRQRRKTDPRWKGFSRDLVRASEVTSPARPGHFLRQFGQSDRETIENASSEATVPQMLTLLNGPIYNQLLSRNSVLRRNLADTQSAEEKLEVIFVTILSRRPTKRDRQIALPTLKQGGNRAVADVVWALLNTRQFMFVQ